MKASNSIEPRLPALASRLAQIGRVAGTILLETIRRWDRDNVSRLAAALSCYSLMSIVPLGILSVGVAGAVFGDAATRGQIARDASSLVGMKAAEAIETAILSARHPHSGISSTVFGIVVLLIGASGVFAELQSAMNTIWNVRPKTGQGVITFIRHRLFAFVMVLVFVLLLFASLLAAAALPFFAKYFEENLWGKVPTWRLALVPLSLAMTTLLFGLLFKIVPDIKVAWKDVWPGAFVTALLFAVGKLLLSLYIEDSAVTTSYGAAGSVVALLIWVYGSSQIIFFGAEFTEVYSRRMNGGSLYAQHRANN